MPSVSRAILFGGLIAGILALRVSANGLLIHAFGVGLPIALAARRFGPAPVPPAGV